MRNLAARLLVKLATLGVLALALLLAGCGLKGALDPPPSDQPKAQAAGQASGATGAGPEGEKPAPPPPRRFFLDFLLN